MTDATSERGPSASSKFFVIGDDDAVLGFRFAGLDGQVVSNEQDARLALQKAARAKVPVVIITDAVAQMIREDVNAIRFEAKTPILVEIPTREGPIEGRPGLLALIHEAIGIHV